MNPVSVKSKATARKWGQIKEGGRGSSNKRKRYVSHMGSSFTLQVQAEGRKEKQLQPSEFCSLGIKNGPGIFKFLTGDFFPVKVTIV